MSYSWLNPVYLTDRDPPFETADDPHGLQGDAVCPMIAGLKAHQRVLLRRCVEAETFF